MSRYVDLTNELVEIHPGGEKFQLYNPNGFSLNIRIGTSGPEMPGICGPHESKFIDSPEPVFASALAPYYGTIVILEGETIAVGA